MKVCLAQLKSDAGNIPANIAKHLKLINSAINQKAELILFPELSLSGYEPSRAKELSMDPKDKRLMPFQKLSDESNIIISLGLPIKYPDGVRIGMIIFQPCRVKTIYCKQLLSPDEEPYFEKGVNQVYINLGSHKMAPAICFEAVQKQHALNASQNGTNIYLASVAKSQKGIETAKKYFPKLAKELNMTIVMSNSTGSCDDFVSAGQSAAWSKNGHVIGELNDQNEGLLFIDLRNENHLIEYFH